MHPFAVFTACATFFLLVAGGLVTSTDSGLAVPDWPLSYGTWFPPMVGGIVYEHGHRVVAAGVGLLILVQALWARWAEPRRWARRLAYAALGLVLAQGLLGGLTVLLLLPPQISIAHACLGQAVFCVTVAFASATGRAAAREPVWRPGPSLGRAGLLAALLAALQLLLGAMTRHTGLGLWWHAANAAALLLAGAWLAARLAGQAGLPAGLRAQAWRLPGLLLAQIMLGVVMLGHRQAVALRTAHVALGALVLAQSVLLAWELLRRNASAPNRQLRIGRALADYLELTKPRLSALVLVTAGVGFWLGLQDAGRLAVIIPALLGTALTAGGANALNQWMEREADALMERTRQRPLPSGRLKPESARRFGLELVVGGVALLAIAVNALAASLAALAALSYLAVYTPLKRLSPLCTLAGAIPGALPPMIGWAAARGTLGPQAWLLFGLLFLWQLPHFLAIAVLYREEYARAGFQMLPVTETAGLVTARHTLLCGLWLVPMSLLPAAVGLAGMRYAAGALLLGTGFLILAAGAAWSRSPAACRRLFQTSILYLPLLLGLLAWDRPPL
ncbi:MAG: protoheme IX farnesyltransferase [Candidatus Omnitrophica bacterium]|nr:protoheme IX farnesyltransferase [Candidatus Omnitrophota bacterium]